LILEDAKSSITLITKLINTVIAVADAVDIRAITNSINTIDIDKKKRIENYDTNCKL
jgi:hypothetical protein